MTEYRIIKDEREFVAHEFETLRELLQRGLLSADDVVSVDGGEPLTLAALGLGEATPSVVGKVERGPPGLGARKTARREPSPKAERGPGPALPGLQGPPPRVGDGPWSHWEDARAREENGDVLSDFLADLAGPTKQRASGEARESRQAGAPSAAVAASTRARSVTPPSSDPPATSPVPHRDAAPIEELDAAPMQHLDASDLAPLDPAPPRPVSTLRLVEPPAAPQRRPDPAPDESAPLSFTDWVDERADGRGADLLENFGRENDGIVLNARRQRGPNWWRTLGLVVIVALGIGAGHTWVRTVATTRYPDEADLIASRNGDGPALPGQPVRTPRAQTAPDTARDNERRLRSLVAGDVAHFGSAEQLENVLFQEFSNLRMRPQRVRVTATRVQNSGDVNRARPIEADIAVLLAGVSDEGGADAQLEGIHERRVLVWLVLGKYGTQGRLALGRVTTEFGPPSPMSDLRDGKDLLKLWTGRASATDLLLADP